MCRKWVPCCTSREGRGGRAGAGGSRLTWLWAGHCGHPAGGQGHSARPHCSHSRREPGPGRVRARGLAVGNRQPGVHVPQPHSTPAPLSTALDMGLVFSAPFRPRTAVRVACFCIGFPFFKRWLKTQLLPGPSQTLTERVDKVPASPAGQFQQTCTDHLLVSGYPRAIG